MLRGTTLVPQRVIAISRYRVFDYATPRRRDRACWGSQPDNGGIRRRLPSVGAAAWGRVRRPLATGSQNSRFSWKANRLPITSPRRQSEEHTSELQSQSNLVCRLLLEKKK